MQLFLAEELTLSSLRLPEEEAKHALKVLRHSPGDVLHCIDGKGTFYEAELIDSQGKTAELRVLNRSENWHEPPERVGLLFPPLKNRNRLEVLLEKSVELGVTDLFPTLTAHTERSQFKPERAQRILVAATKQCLRSRIPELHALRPFAEQVASFSPGGELYAAFSTRYLAHCRGAAAFREQFPPPAGGGCLYAIGPEGDFSPGEVEQAREAGFRKLQFGEQRLRAETAGLFLLGAHKTARLLQDGPGW